MSIPPRNGVRMGVWMASVAMAALPSPWRPPLRLQCGRARQLHRRRRLPARCCGPPPGWIRCERRPHPDPPHAVSDRKARLLNGLNCDRVYFRCRSHQKVKRDRKTSSMFKGIWLIVERNCIASQALLRFRSTVELSSSKCGRIRPRLQRVADRPRRLENADAAPHRIYLVPRSSRICCPRTLPRRC